MFSSILLFFKFLLSILLFLLVIILFFFFSHFLLLAGQWTDESSGMMHDFVRVLQTTFHCSSQTANSLFFRPHLSHYMDGLDGFGKKKQMTGSLKIIIVS